MNVRSFLNRQNEDVSAEGRKATCEIQTPKDIEASITNNSEGQNLRFARESRK